STARQNPKLAPRDGREATPIQSYGYVWSSAHSRAIAGIPADGVDDRRLLSLELLELVPGLRACRSGSTHVDILFRSWAQRSIIRPFVDAVRWQISNRWQLTCRCRTARRCARADRRARAGRKPPRAPLAPAAD